MKINVPGVGDIEVEGAAEESTLQSILKVLGKTDKKAADTHKKEQDAKKANTKALDEQTDSIDDMIAAAERSVSASSKSSKAVGELASSSIATGEQVKNFGKSLAATAAAVAIKMMTNFDDNAERPIRAGKALLDTGVDLVAQVGKIGVGAVGGAFSGLLGIIPFVGGGLQKIGEAGTELAKNLIDLGASLAKIANEKMSREYEKLVDSMKVVTSSGASLAKGLDEFGQIATDSKLGIVSFSNIIKVNSKLMNEYGITSSESVKLLSSKMADLTKTTKTLSGASTTTREQLLNLGYSYEDQGNLMAGFLIQQKQAGINLAKLAPQELTNSLKEYAVNLKVLSDITGKDAKKAQDEALRESMYSDIASTLTNPAELKKFQAAYAATPDSLKKAFLEYNSKIGVIADRTTNVLMSQNTKVRDFFIQQKQDIHDSSKSVEDVTTNSLTNLIEAGKANIKATETISASGRYIGGMAGDVAKMSAELNPYGLKNEQQVKESYEAAKSQMNTISDTTRNFSKLTDTMVEVQVTMEEVFRNNLPEYSTIMKTAADETLRAVRDAIRVASGKATIEQIAKERGAPGLLKPRQDKDFGAAAAEGFVKGFGDGAKYGRTAGLINGGIGSVNGVIGEGWNRLKNEVVGGSESPKFGKGGIATGAISGFQATLHGTEAVVPLPDGKSIPVKLDSSALSSSINQQTNILQELLSAIHQGNGINNKILQNTM